MPCSIPFFNPALGNKVDVLVIGKERWFRVSDIAKALGYCDGSSITYRWQEEVRVFAQKDLPGVNLGARMVRFITSDGLLALLISSSRPLAQLLRKWIIEEVLPSVDSFSYDTNTGQSALDKAILKEFEALKKTSLEIRGKRNEQLETAIKNAAHAILSWVENAPQSHVKYFQEALEKMESIATEADMLTFEANDKQTSTSN